MSQELDGTLLKATQVEATKEGYNSLYEQLEFGRFNGTKGAAAPTLYEEFVSIEGQTDFTLTASRYVVGDHSLQVFVNGQCMRAGTDNDYQEIDNRTIRFNFGLEKDDIIVLRVAGGSEGPAIHENVRATEGQTIFTLNVTYTTGNNSLVVFVNGAYQTIGVDYIETDSKTVTFLEPLEENDLVTFRAEGLQATQTVYRDNTITRLYDGNKHLLREEQIGEGLHIIKEYYRDSNGKPEKMIIRESGFVIERRYTWNGFRCTGIIETVKEMT